MIDRLRFALHTGNACLRTPPSAYFVTINDHNARDTMNVETRDRSAVECHAIVSHQVFLSRKIIFEIEYSSNFFFNYILVYFVELWKINFQFLNIKVRLNYKIEKLLSNWIFIGSNDQKFHSRKFIYYILKILHAIFILKISFFLNYVTSTYFLLLVWNLKKFYYKLYLNCNYIKFHDNLSVRYQTQSWSQITIVMQMYNSICIISKFCNFV